MEVVACGTCGGAVPQKRGPGHVYRYCSQKCSAASRRGRPLKPLVVIPCAVCGKGFRVFPSRVGVSKYCSRECGEIGSYAVRSAAVRASYTPALRARRRADSTASWKENRGAHDRANAAPAYRRLRSEAALGRWADPEKRARYLAALGPAWREKLRARVPSPPIKWRVYAGLRMRSQWEVTFARLLDLLGCAYVYEPRQFWLSDGSTYTPDFFVETPLGACYVELHRVEKPKPGDERKVRKLGIASVDLPAQTGLPYVLIGESGMRAVEKHARRKE